jgi:glycosyltransferase involved in cell wall biosynthesis
MSGKHSIPTERTAPVSDRGSLETEPQSHQQEQIGVSVIIPTFNESKNISACITECLKALPEEGFDAEVIVVDDDSDDYTWQYPRRLFGHDPRVSVLHRQSDEKGLARSVADGLESATHEYSLLPERVERVLPERHKIVTFCII